MTWSEPFTTKAEKKEVGESKSYGAPSSIYGNSRSAY
jgi:hypothetical protein